MSWSTVKLGSVIDFIRGVTFKPEDQVEPHSSGSTVVMRTKNIQVKGLDESDLIAIPTALIKREEQFLMSGDILISSANSWELVGKSSYIDGLNYQATAGGFISIVRPQNKKLFPKYLYYWITNPTIQSLIRNCGRKTTNISNLDVNQFKELTIPLYNLAEQKRIAAILDKADAIRRKRQQAIELADEFLRSVFLDMFGDPVTNPKDFPVGTIRDLVDSVNYGTSSKASEIDGEYPILRMGNITYNGDWDFTSLKYIDLAEKEKAKYLVSKGDLLFNRTNSKELVGKTAVYEEDKPMAIAGYLIRVRPNSNGNNHYISGYLNSMHGKEILMAMCKNIVGMANINAQELQDIKILIPPKKYQDQYANIVITTKSKVKKLKQALAEADILFKALSQRAFAGEL